MKTTIYIEGGGKTKQLHSELRHGFKTLFEKAGFSDKLPKVVACGSRNDAFGDFKTAFKKKKEDDLETTSLESIDKATLYDGLKKATKNTSKGEYGKGQHSFKILTYLDARKVENHGEYSKEFFEYLRNEL